MSGASQIEFHDLAHPLAGETPKTGQVRVVARFTPLDHVLKLDRQRHHLRDSRETPRWRAAGRPTSVPPRRASGWCSAKLNFSRAVVHARILLGIDRRPIAQSP